MRILFVATQLPYPPDTGGRIRTLSLLKHLTRNHDLTFVCAVDPNTPAQDLDEMRRVCPKFYPVRQTQVNRSSWRYFTKLAANMGSLQPFGVAKDYSPELASLVKRLSASGESDVLVCDFLHATINLKGVNGIPVVLFQHNVEAEIFRRYYLQQTKLPGRLFWFYQWKKMQRYERRISRDMDCCIAVSETDRETFRRDYQLTNVARIDTGVDVDYFSGASAQRIPHRLVFTGSMDWLPNEDAMVWFVREILPTVTRALPDTSLAIVGRRPTPKVQQLARNHQVIITGRVDDVRLYLAEGSVFIVPIRIGGGTRIKIFEAMASNIPVVSTTVGAEGLELEDGRHLLLSDDPKSFAQSVIRLLQDRNYAQQLAGSARSLVAEKYDWSIVSKQFATICLHTIKERKAQTA